MNKHSKCTNIWQKISVKATGAFWLGLALLIILDIALNRSNSIFLTLFNNNIPATVTFIVFCFFRGSIAAFSTKVYLKIFRAGLFKKTDNNWRAIFLFSFTASWITCALVSNFIIPNWLISWGIIAWGVLLIPYIDKNSLPQKPVAQCKINAEGKLEYNGIINLETMQEYNPATGLPMIGAIDVDGNPYGIAQWK